MSQALRSVRPGGGVGVVGVSHGVTIDGQELFFSHVHVQGGPAPVRRFLPDLIDASSAAPSTPAGLRPDPAAGAGRRWLRHCVIVTAQAFANAVAATDNPPLLVLLNSCNSASQIDRLVEEVAPFVIGMADEIDDGDANAYAAQFYAAVAHGQSIR